MVFRDNPLRLQISRIGSPSRNRHLRITLNNATSITPLSPARISDRSVSSRGSNFDANIGLRWVSFQCKSTDLVAVIDADCTFDPHQILNMLPLLGDGVSAIIASPFHNHGTVMHVPPWRLLLSRTAALMYRQVMHNQLTSYTSCFRIYRRALIVGMEIDNLGFCGVTEILARLDLDGHQVVETPAVLQVRLLGQSKIRLVRVIFDHLRLLTRIILARYFAIKMR